MAALCGRLDLYIQTRTEAVHIALKEIVALKGFKKLMKEHAGKHRFAGLGE